MKEKLHKFLIAFLIISSFVFIYQSKKENDNKRKENDKENDNERKENDNERKENNEERIVYDSDMLQFIIIMIILIVLLLGVSFGEDFFEEKTSTKNNNTLTSIPNSEKVIVYDAKGEKKKRQIIINKDHLDKGYYEILNVVNLNSANVRLYDANKYFERDVLINNDDNIIYTRKLIR